jgi:hypothetical protein
MTQLDYQSIPESLRFNSQRGGLIAFGVIFIICGLFLLLGALSLPLAILLSGQQQFAWTQMIPLALMYLVWAGMFIFAGVDNIRARRWVRPVGIVCGLLGLIGGVIGSVAFAIQWSQMQSMIAAQSGGNPAAAAGAKIGLVIGLVFVVLLYVILPAVIFWFYRRPSVQKTVLFYDQSPSWTDDKPLVLIAAVLIEFAVAASMPVMLMYDAFPLFAILVKGVTAVALYTLLTIVHVVAAFLLIKRRDSGIWLAMLLAGFQMASTIVAMAKHGFNAVFAQPDFANFAGNKAVISTSPPAPSLTLIFILWGTMFFAWCLFLVHVRKKLHVVPSLAGEAPPV